MPDDNQKAMQLSTADHLFERVFDPELQFL
jgi:hypothetical protein